MDNEMSNTLVETMMGILESHGRLTELLEETIRRQDDLIYELRRVVDQRQDIGLIRDLPQQSPDTSKMMPFLEATSSRPASLAGKCAGCPHYTGEVERQNTTSDTPAGYMVTEWSQYPIWSAYAPSSNRPRYRSK